MGRVESRRFMETLHGRRSVESSTQPCSLQHCTHLVWSESSRPGVEGAGVEAVNQQMAVQTMLDPVCEAVLGQDAPVETQHGIVGNPPECKNHRCILQLWRQPGRGTCPDLRDGRSIRRGQASDRVRDVDIPRSVTFEQAGVAHRLLEEPGRWVPIEGATGPVGSVGSGSEPHEDQGSVRLPPASHWCIVVSGMGLPARGQVCAESGAPTAVLQQSRHPVG